MQAKHIPKQLGSSSLRAQQYTSFSNSFGALFMLPSMSIAVDSILWTSLLNNIICSLIVTSVPAQYLVRPFLYVGNVALTFGAMAQASYSKNLESLFNGTNLRNPLFKERTYSKTSPKRSLSTRPTQSQSSMLSTSNFANSTATTNQCDFWCKINDFWCKINDFLAQDQRLSQPAP